eukprot:scaffold64816_cov23-Tisochrysis_lutea.AAC.1
MSHELRHSSTNIQSRKVLQALGMYTMPAPRAAMKHLKPWFLREECQGSYVHMLTYVCMQVHRPPPAA